jgi:hypothetical protein
MLMANEIAPGARIRIIVTTADKSRKAEVTLPSTMTVGELVATCKKNWSLPAGEDFAIRDASRNVQLGHKETLGGTGIVDGATLEVYPLLEAGVPWRAYEIGA